MFCNNASPCLLQIKNLAIFGSKQHPAALHVIWQHQVPHILGHEVNTLPVLSTAVANLLTNIIYFKIYFIVNQIFLY